MRRPRTIAAVAAAALLVAACGGQDDDSDAEARITDLETELDEAREDNEELLAENERLAEELRLAEDGAPDGTTGDADGQAPDDADADDAGDAEGDAEVDGEPGADGADGDPPTEEPDPDQPATAPGQPRPERSAEGLVDQLRTLFDQDDGPGEWEPGTTAWSSTDPPDGLDATYDDPGTLALHLAAALDAELLGTDTWETTTRVLLDDDDPDLGYVAVLSWGWLDDAIAGRDLRMTITRSDGTWGPGGVEERFHCRRGVTDDELCV